MGGMKTEALSTFLGVETTIGAWGSATLLLGGIVQSIGGLPRVCVRREVRGIII